MVAQVSPPSAYYSIPGRSNYQHDRHLIHHAERATIYAVADGHGPHATGHIVSEYCVQHLPSLLHTKGALSRPRSHEHIHSTITSTIDALDTAAIQMTSKMRLYAGSTLCAVIRHDDSLVCFNVGDSRAILVSCLPGKKPRSYPLSKDHVCTEPEERRRIERAGGVVVGNLLNGHISMSRAMGDDELKTHRNITDFAVPGTMRSYSSDLFISRPDVHLRPTSDDDVFVVIASDGVWGKLTNDEVSTIVCKSLAAGESVEQAAKAVVKRALSKGSRDNSTVVVALLKDSQHVRHALQQTMAKKSTLKRPGRALSSQPSTVSSSDSMNSQETTPDSSGQLTSSSDTVTEYDENYSSSHTSNHRSGISLWRNHSEKVNQSITNTNTPVTTSRKQVAKSKLVKWVHRNKSSV